ncbi:hypothetical protein BDW74DRAFT_147753 [Aspergillus multicolor]|uniref:uncharacterized protein n=1 Tax=Aspergillus multicolor TaxID=41759 RepID=UPI003CCCEA34
MVVQASVEDGYEGLVATFSQARESSPNLVLRGTIAMQSPWKEPDPATFDSLHALGVRSIRIHGPYGGADSQPETIRRLLRSLSCSFAVQSLGWSVSAQLPLHTWAELEGALLSDPGLAGLRLIADHGGCATPSDIGSGDLEAFLRLLQSRRLAVKVSALYRRSPDKIEAMGPIIQAFADAAPDTLLWGSDWPHVDATAGGCELPPLRGPPDVARELQLLHSWLTEEQWRAMMEENPRSMFA